MAKLLNPKALLAALALSGLWLWFFYEGVSSAIAVWASSEIFSHCFFVLPISAYLIYRKREALNNSEFRAQLWLAPLLLLLLLLYMVGQQGSINVFMHAATFASIPVIIWMCIGSQAAKVILFPLFFMLFAIPIGDQLIPHLQVLTADLSVPLLRWTGVPIFRNGLYIEIPEGRFLVAEACSGISFLITSMVVGHLYAYLSFKRFRAQALFVLVSLAIPILANALRVYGIILTGHLSNMEHAVGADHLIYGGVFYAIVLGILLFVGELFRDKSTVQASEAEPKPSSSLANYSPTALYLGLAMLTAFSLWQLRIEQLPVQAEQMQLALPGEQVSGFQGWKPSFKKADASWSKQLVTQQGPVDIYAAAFHSGQGELVANSNQLFDTTDWTVLSQRQVELHQQRTANSLQLSNPLGEHRYLLYWYEVAERGFASPTRAKLYQTYSRLLGQAEQGKIVALSFADPKELLTQDSFEQQLIDQLHIAEPNYY